MTIVIGIGEEEEELDETELPEVDWDVLTMPVVLELDSAWPSPSAI